MMTHEMVSDRRRAGLALVAGLAALWLSVFPLAAASLAFRLLGLVGFVLAIRWAVDPDHPTRRKVASLAMVLAVVTQLQNFAHRLSLGPESRYADFVRFFLADNGVPAFLLLSVALLPRLGRRRSETALLWVSFGLAAIFTLVGTANGTMMQTRGDPSPGDYQFLLVALRTISFAPAVAAAILLIIPARETLTEEQAWQRVEQLQAQTRASLREAAAALDAAPADPEVTTEAAPAPPPTPARSSDQPSNDILGLLEGRLARGEISEATYLQLRAKYGTR